MHDNIPSYIYTARDALFELKIAEKWQPVLSRIQKADTHQNSLYMYFKIIIYSQNMIGLFEVLSISRGFPGYLAP